MTQPVSNQHFSQRPAPAPLSSNASASSRTPPRDSLESAASPPEPAGPGVFEQGVQVFWRYAVAAYHWVVHFFEQLLGLRSTSVASSPLSDKHQPIDLVQEWRRAIEEGKSPVDYKVQLEKVVSQVLGEERMCQFYVALGTRMVPVGVLEKSTTWPTREAWAKRHLREGMQWALTNLDLFCSITIPLLYEIETTLLSNSASSPS